MLLLNCMTFSCFAFLNTCPLQLSEQRHAPEHAISSSSKQCLEHAPLDDPVCDGFPPAVIVHHAPFVLEPRHRHEFDKSPAFLSSLCIQPAQKFQIQAHNSSSSRKRRAFENSQIRKFEAVRANSTGASVMKLEDQLWCNCCNKWTTEFLKDCVGCLECSRCNLECQRGDWKTHRKVCICNNAQGQEDGETLSIPCSMLIPKDAKHKCNFLDEQHEKMRGGKDLLDGLEGEMCQGHHTSL